MDNVINVLKNIQDECIIIGVSAGPDSMALLHLTSNITSKKIICAHINHGIRIESNEEEEYLKNYCNNHNLTFESIKITNWNEKNFENEARKKRYTFYEKVLKKYHSHTLLLAHHGDDLIETILMKIVRGSNLEGYAGIKLYSKQKDYTIIRPFLYLTKEDILKYNKENNIKYYIDKTNTNHEYTRNRYREKLLPLLKQEDELVHLKFLNYSNTLQEYYNYVEEISLEKINTLYKNNIINLDIFKKEHPFIKKNIIFHILSNIYNNESNIIKNKHIEEIIMLSKSNKANATINLPNNYIANKIYNKITITKKNIDNQKEYKVKLDDYCQINNFIIKKIVSCETNGNDVCRLNSNNIKLPLYLRNKKDGDYIEVLGMNGKKKIKDIFIEKKIPLKERKYYPILVDSNDNILWIPNLKKSKYNVKNNQFYDIILTSYKESEENNENKKTSK